MSAEPPLARDVVLVSTADWDHPFWTNKQRVARSLAECGRRVLYVESLGLRRPSAAPRDVRRMARRLSRAWRPPRLVEPNIWVASPLVAPWHGAAACRYVNDRALALQLRASLSRLGFDRPLLWTYNPLAGAVAPGLGASLTVYHAVDDLSAAPHLPSATMRDAELQLARTADVVFTTSEALQTRFAAERPGGTHYLPNVADFDHFNRANRRDPIPADLAAIPRPRIGFIGAVSGYKVDFELIAAVARARPDWQWVLIGLQGEGQPGVRLDRLRAPNIHLFGPRPYAQLPDYLRGLDVATIPAPANPYTAAMFPLKFFEYLAAGRPVVASHVPALREFAEVCDLVDSPVAFLAAIERALAGGADKISTRLRVARQYTWRWRMDQMLSILAAGAHQRAPWTQMPKAA